MSIRAKIISEMQQIASEHGLAANLRPLSDDLALTDSGLDSLMIAILVARLEDKLGFDPFTDIAGNSYPVTVGDFIRLYEATAPRPDTVAEQAR